MFTRWLVMIYTINSVGRTWVGFWASAKALNISFGHGCASNVSFLRRCLPDVSWWYTRSSWRVGLVLGFGHGLGIGVFRKCSGEDYTTNLFYERSSSQSFEKFFWTWLCEQCFLSSEMFTKCLVMIYTSNLVGRTWVGFWAWAWDRCFEEM